MHPIPLDQMLPDAGQGALSLQCRRDDQRTHDLLAPLNDAPTHLCVDLERAVVAGLEGDCFSPIATLAELIGSQINLRVAVGRRGGKLPVIQAHAFAPVSNAQTAVASVLKLLSDHDVHSHLHG